MSDSETLRAAAEVLRKRRPGWSPTYVYLDTAADEFDAEDAAQLKAAERDQRLAQVAAEAYHSANGSGGGWWVEVARAVREAIEAEQ